MNTLLTLNNLGYAKDIAGGPEYNEKYGVFFFASEQSHKPVTYFNLKDFQEKQIVIGKLVKGVNDSVDLYHGKLTFKFKNNHIVELSWKNGEGDQTATFNEVSLVQLMEVEWVRILVKNRTAGYL